VLEEVGMGHVVKGRYVTCWKRSASSLNLKQNKELTEATEHGSKF